MNDAIASVDRTAEDGVVIPVCFRQRAAIVGVRLAFADTDIEPQCRVLHIEPKIGDAVAAVGGAVEDGIAIITRLSQRSAVEGVGFTLADVDIEPRCGVLYIEPMIDNAVAAHHIADCIDQEGVRGINCSVPGEAVAHRYAVDAESRRTRKSIKKREATVDVGGVGCPMAIAACCVVGIHPGVEDGEQVGISTVTYCDNTVQYTRIGECRRISQNKWINKQGVVSTFERNAIHI